MVKGFPSTPAEGDNGTVNALIYWCYAMIGIAAFCAVVFGVAVSVANNPKSLITILVGVVAAAVVCGLAYVLAPKPALLSACLSSRPSGHLNSRIQYFTS